MISRPNLVSFYLLSLASTVSSSSPSSSANFKRDGWKPPHELDPTIPFILGGAVPAGQGVPLRNDKGPFNYWDDPANSKPSTPSISIPEETTMANTTKLNGLDIDRLLLPEHAPPLHVAPLPKEASTWTWACNPISECEPCPENSVIIRWHYKLQEESVWAWLSYWLVSLFPLRLLSSRSPLLYLHCLLARFTTHTADLLEIERLFIVSGLHRKVLLWNPSSWSLILLKTESFPLWAGRLAERS